MFPVSPKDAEESVREFSLGVLIAQQTSFAENVQPGTDAKCLLSKFLTEGLFPYGVGYRNA